MDLLGGPVSPPDLHASMLCLSSIIHADCRAAAAASCLSFRDSCVACWFAACRGRQVAVDVAEALNHLHSAQKEIHGDVKAG